MMIRLSVDARSALLTSAAQEAQRRGDRRLGTDHLLLGLLHDPGSPTTSALGFSLQDARAAGDALDRAALAAVGVEVDRLGSPARPAHARRHLPLTSGARAVFKSAVDEVRAARSGRIETRSFLGALLALERPDPAAELLEALGVDRAEVRRRLASTTG